MPQTEGLFQLDAINARANQLDERNMQRRCWVLKMLAIVVDDVSSATML